MPGKYSHGLVLAHYSAQGIISLPNDGYLKSSAQPRAASAAAFRQRTTSITTRSSGFHSVASRSAKSVGEIQQPRSHNLSGNATTTTPRRVVIVSTDSESENDTDESEAEWVRPQVIAPSVRSNGGKGLHRANPPNLNQSRNVRPDTQGADFGRARPTPNPKVEKPELEEKPLAQVTPKKKKGGGVRALMQARYEAEMKKAAEEASGEDNEDTGLSLREILRTPAAPKEKALTVQEFLSNVPDPSTRRTEGTLEEISPQPATSTPNPTERSSVRSSQKARATAGSAYQQQNSKNQVHTSKPSTSQSAKAPEAEPSFDGFSDSEEQSDFPFPTISDPGRKPQTSSKVHQTSERSANPRPEPSPTVVTHKQPAQDAIASERAITPTLKNARRLEMRKAKPVGNHKRAESSLASLESDMSSIFGMSSVGGTTQATSGYSLAPRSVTKLANSKTWDSPQIRHGGTSDDFGDMFRDINNTTTIFTSDEEEDQHDEERDLPAPRLQSIPESDLFRTGRWGMISSGQNTSNRARDEDEMSDMSAVFPPDIGRYKHDGYAGSPLAMALSGQSEPKPKLERSRSFKKKLQKEKKEGLLQKLRAKASR